MLIPIFKGVASVGRHGWKKTTDVYIKDRIKSVFAWSWVEADGYNSPRDME
jgi:hypothetical protein